MTEERRINSLRYFPISPRIIVEALEGKSQKQLHELGMSEGLLLMIREGHANQLRQDVFDQLSHGLNLDISG